MKPARSRPRTVLAASPISLLRPTIMAANTTMCISALLYSPLYTAPSPGKKPRTKAIPGVLAERPGRDAHTPNTGPFRNCGSTRQRPPQNGRHTSWPSPLAHRAIQSGEIRGQKLKISANLVSAVLLMRRGGIGVVGLARFLLGRGLRNRFLPACGILLAFVHPRLYFVNDAQIADEFCGVRVNEVGLAVGVVVDGRRGKIRQLRLAPRKA